MNRRRDQFTDWHNREPIADIHELLHLLKPKRHGHRLDWRYLCGKKRQPEHPAELLVAWYYKGYSDGEGRGYRYYEVESGIAKRLVQERLVEPDVIADWGNFRIENNKLVLSNKGRKLLDKYICEQAEEAKELLIPGAHGKAGDIFRYRDYGRDGQEGDGGEFYFEFETLQGEHVRVYSASKRILYLAHERAA